MPAGGGANPGQRAPYGYLANSPSDLLLFTNPLVQGTLPADWEDRLACTFSLRHLYMKENRKEEMRHRSSHRHAHAGVLLTSLSTRAKNALLMKSLHVQVSQRSGVRVCGQWWRQHAGQAGAGSGGGHAGAEQDTSLAGGPLWAGQGGGAHCGP